MWFAKVPFNEKLNLVIKTMVRQWSSLEVSLKQLAISEQTISERTTLTR